MDKRKNYILMLDTETANTLVDESGKMNMDDVLFYDVGWEVIDKWGNVYASASYVNSDIFLHEIELMRSAYYAKKIPQYFNDLRSGKRKLATCEEIHKAMAQTIKDYNIKIVCAHNARFDYNSLNRTRSFLSQAKKRYWFTYDSIEWWDTLKMAKSVIAKMPTYIKFCEKHKFLTKAGKPKLTAEALYCFITRNPNFSEKHTGLEDVEIEKEILVYCFRQHKPMEKLLWVDNKPKQKMTAFQKNLWRSIKQNPMMRV